jgi:hypothetical protein
MVTKRRQIRKRQTRRRRQTGGGEAEDREIIRTIHTEVKDAGVMIAMIYKTKSIYDKCTEYAPASPLGRGHVIPDRYSRPKAGMKPLNSVLRCAYNFFDIYANKARGNNAEPPEWEMARQICQKLNESFWIFMAADYDPEHRIAPSKAKVKKADNLFGRISHFIEVLSGPSRAEMEAAARERVARGEELERKEAERARKIAEEARKTKKPCGGAGCEDGSRPMTKNEESMLRQKYPEWFPGFNVNAAAGTLVAVPDPSIYGKEAKSTAW